MSHAIVFRLLNLTLVCALPGNGAGAEIGRSQHTGHGKKQERVHRSHGEVESGERGGSANPSSGPRLL